MYSNFEFLPISFLVYVENGRSTTATTLTFTTASTSGITWKAKVTQIECSRWFTSVLVCFSLLLNHLIHRDKNDASKSWSNLQIIFTHKDNFFSPLAILRVKSSFPQLVTIGLFFSVDIMIFDFLHFVVFLKCNT